MKFPGLEVTVKAQVRPYNEAEGFLFWKAAVEAWRWTLEGDCKDWSSYKGIEMRFPPSSPFYSICATSLGLVPPYPRWVSPLQSGMQANAELC